MNQELLKKLSIITDEERSILEGNHTIDRTLYYSLDTSESEDVIDASRVLQNGRLIDMRPHVRFIHFPKHTHNYVEFIYMCQGSTTHIVDGQKIVLEEGDLLFLNQHATQEIYPANESDIAVNFMIRPEFFDMVLPMMSAESNSLQDFLISCLTKKNADSNFLYFHVADLLPVQNLMENLIWNMMDTTLSNRALNQTTIGLLFLNLANHTERIHMQSNSFDQELTLKALSYIDTCYADATLTEFAKRESIDISAISRILKKETGHTFKELLQTKRLELACVLLEHSNAPIADIALSVGYDNTSFFHRIFRRIYGCSPREYRIQKA
ncbi:MAG: AraC family transcriptional regulator [Lachnospiraceae bacterium]|nr:AraC family transcriptional regulator [Lachnospiraceae bacterium]